jgi:hypothetical protein
MIQTKISSKFKNASFLLKMVHGKSNKPIQGMPPKASTTGIVCGRQQAALYGEDR